MSRWIDADALITKLKEYNPQTSKVKVAQIVVNNLPSIDIVRCKECKHNWDGLCTETNHLVDGMVTFDALDDDFCSHGERRE